MLDVSPLGHNRKQEHTMYSTISNGSLDWSALLAEAEARQSAIEPEVLVGFDPAHSAPGLQAADLFLFLPAPIHSNTKVGQCESSA